MELFGILVVFVIVWWLVFFMTLPFGVKHPGNVEPGHAPSAPDRPRLVIKVAIASAIAAALTGAVVIAVEYDLLAFRDLVRPD
jgi:predicted secreted protein